MGPEPRALAEIGTHAVYLTPCTQAGLPDISERNLWDACREANRQLGAPVYEGIVTKRLDSPYPVQLRNPAETTPAWMKHRWHF